MSAPSSTFRFLVGMPKRIEVRPPGKSRAQPVIQVMDREDFCTWVSGQLNNEGLLGIHEGTLLSAEAANDGLETESWTVDAGEAPRERDWIGDQKRVEAEFYFESRESAEKAMGFLKRVAELSIGPIQEQLPEDWDAQWKASFLATPGGVRIPPIWRVLPPWVKAEDVGLGEGERVLRINPGAGFGTGTHETTQLCLGSIAEVAALAPLTGRPVLDFGSGSGILSIGAALLGGKVEAVEIDPLANENALENSRLNGVEGKVAIHTELSTLRESTYDLVIANILKPVLLEFCGALVARMKKLENGGALILSGLIQADVEPVSLAYGAVLGGMKPRVREQGEWRALVWERLSGGG